MKIIRPHLLRALGALLASLAATLGTAQLRTPVVPLDPAYFGYLMIPGITGGVTTPSAYAGWFAIGDFSVGATAPGGANPIPLTATARGEFTLASPLLFAAALAGTNFPTVSIHLFRSRPTPTLVELVDLTNATILELTQDATTEVMEQRLELRYQSIRWTWRRQGGDVSSTWTPSGGLNPRRLTAAQTAASPFGGKFFALVEVAGVRGDSTRPGYVDWIQATDFAFGLQRAVDAAGGVTTQVQNPTVSVQLALDRALPVLIERTVTGAQIPNVRLHLFRTESDPTPFLELDLTQVGIKSFGHRVNARDGGLRLEFAAGIFEWAHTNPTTGQRTRRCFNFITGTSC